VACIDVFNGDADGICALHQLRLAEPRDSTLVTGLKRDIQLLASVRASRGDQVTVLDVSLDRNRAALEALLACGAHVRYFDHHYAGVIPQHPNLDAVIDASGAFCTSGLVDRYLGARRRVWAVAGAFGDAFEELAVALARALCLDDARIAILRELGTAINYNAYGESEGDVAIAPADLYRVVARYEDPFELFRAEPVVAYLCRQREADLQRALAIPAACSSPAADAYVLPDEAWSRRVSGTFANRLVRDSPGRAHAVLTPQAGGSYIVSVRSVRGRAPSAVDFCRRFPTGGGRLTAAGIDAIDPAALPSFLAAFAEAFAE
jgi:hypothetical protein